MSPKPGYKTSIEHFAPLQLVELSILSEAFGFDSTSINHPQPWPRRSQQEPFPRFHAPGHYQRQFLTLFEKDPAPLLHAPAELVPTYS